MVYEINLNSLRFFKVENIDKIFKYIENENLNIENKNKENQENIVKYISKEFIKLSNRTLIYFNYQNRAIKKIQYIISRFQKRPRHITYYFKNYGKWVANIYLITIFFRFNRF